MYVYIHPPPTHTCILWYLSDEVLLLQVGLEEGQVYVFDVKENAKLIIEGQLWRLLQTPDVVKVC